MMKKWKKILSVLLSMILVLGLVPADGMGFVLEKMGAWIEVQAEGTASTSGTCGDNLTWVLSEDGVLTISGTGKMDNWSTGPNVPWCDLNAEINRIVINDGVTSIGNRAFMNCSSLIEITIPGSVMSIGHVSFYNCNNLTEITIPEGVTSIGSAVFENCSSLTEIILPDSVVSIGNNAFENCSSLAKISIPYGVTSIGKYAFENCSSLVEINIPASVTSIEGCAFESCSSLKEISIPESVTSIEYDVFSGCSSLAKISIPESIISIGSSAFSGCSSLTELNIPANVTSIGSGAFMNCSGLTEITIPERMSSIERSTFFGCSSLTGIILPESVTSIGNYAFYGCSSLTEISFPVNMTSIGEYAFMNCSSLKEATFSASETNVGNSAFWACDNLTKIILLDGVTTITRSAFYNCSSLTEISIPESVTSIEGYAFYNCKNLKEISIPAGVTSIGDYTFRSCSSLTKINIPVSVTAIGTYAFYNCTSLADVYYNGSEEEWNEISIGSNNEYLTRATIHYSESGSGSSGSDKEIYSIQIDSDIEHGKVSAPSSGEEGERITVSVTPEEVYKLKQLTVTMEDGETIEASAQDENTYTFTMPAANVAISAVFSLSIRDLQCSSSAAVEVGDTGVLNSKVFEDSYEDLKILTEEIEWMSSDPSVVEVGKVGYFTMADSVKYTIGEEKVDVWNAMGITNIIGVSPGTATITGKADGVSVACEVTVTEPEDMESSEGGSFTLGEDISGSAGSDSGVSQFFPADWSLKHSVFPVEIIVTEDKEEGTYKIRGTIGIGKSDWLNNDAKWSKYKQNVEDASKYSGSVDCLDSFRKTWNVKSVTAVSTEKFNVLPKVSVMGYFENVYDRNMNPISTIGKLAADAKWEGSIDWQFVTPIGPFYLTLKGGGELSGNIGPEYDYNTKTVNVVDGELKLTPSIKIEGGYGIYKVATLGAYGKLSAPITIFPATKGEWEASASLHIEVVFLLDFEQELLSSSGTLWDTTGSSKARTKAAANASGSTLPSVGTTLTAGTASYVVTTVGSAVTYAKNLNTKATSAVVPASVKIGGVTYKVTSIGNNAFKNNKKLKKVTIGSNVTSIGNSAFKNCTALKKVVIPAKVKQIGKKAFYNCKKLQSLTVKTKKLIAKTVGAKAFTGAGSSNYAKLKVKVPKKKYATYVKMLKKKGLSARAKVSR